MRKIKNRIFALFFFIIILLWVIWSPIWDEVITGSVNVPKSYPYWQYLNPFILTLLIVPIGLLYEIYRPSLNFKLDKNKKWIAVGIFLFTIAILVVVAAAILEIDEPEQNILGNRVFEFPRGSGQIHVWPNLLWEFLSIFCMETVSFSLLFGFLFMTKSTPQTSKSYKIMLYGAIAFELFVFIFLYLIFFITGGGFSQYSNYTRIGLLTQYWFHWDFWPELVILVGSIWLLKRGK